MWTLEDSNVRSGGGVPTFRSITSLFFASSSFSRGSASLVLDIVSGWLSCAADASPAVPLLGSAVVE